MAFLTHLTSRPVSCLKRDTTEAMMKLSKAVYHVSLNCLANIASARGRIPVITVPVKLQSRIRKLEKVAARKSEDRRITLSRRGNINRPIVTCRRPSFNYYEGQTLGKFEVVPLTSKGWNNKNKADGDSFTINRFDNGPRTCENQWESKATFTDLNLKPELIDRLQQLNIKHPSKIQMMAIPPILRGHNTMCAAETGSGKTMTYLLPIIQQILINKENNDNSKSNAPIALVLVPNRELADQIYKVTCDLTHALPITTSVLIGGAKTKTFMLRPQVYKIDILISSLGVIRKLVSSGIYSLSNLKHLVIDESDTMLDASFNDYMLTFLRKIKFRDNAPLTATDCDVNTQLTLIGATLPVNMEVVLQNIIEVRSIVKLTTQHLHRLMGHVPQTFIRLKKSAKPAKLLQLVKDDISKKRPVMIFSKNSATADFIQIFLKENGVTTITFHSNMKAHLREGRFEKFQESKYDVISCTDIASRGLDTARVHHVINYDFPIFISDYIHRVGRVGRLSSVETCKVTNFVSTPEEIQLVQKIETAAKMMEPLTEVNANIKGQIVKKISALEDEEFL